MLKLNAGHLITAQSIDVGYNMLHILYTTHICTLLLFNRPLFSWSLFIMEYERFLTGLYRKTLGLLKWDFLHTKVQPAGSEWLEWHMWCTRKLHVVNIVITCTSVMVDYDNVGNPPQGNQEPSVVKDMTGRLQVSLVIKSMECVCLPSVLWHCWLGDRKSIRPVKNWVLVCCWWRFDWNFARFVAPVVTAISHHL